MGKKPQIIDGVKIAQKINAQTGRIVNALAKKGKKVKLAVVMIGDNPASAVYVERKEKLAKQLGVDFISRKYPEDLTIFEMVSNLKDLQKKENPDGLIVQLPVPEGLYASEVFNAIDSSRDVDFLNEQSLGKIMFGDYDIEPPTPGAIMTVLREIGTDLKGKDVTLVGMGALIGRPLTMLLDESGASITTCNSKTKNLKEKCLNADIIISGVGKKDLIQGDMVKPGAIVIDAGFVFENGKSYGDVNFEEVSKVAKYVTPTPGGVGPITVALLLSNTVKRALL